MITSIKNLLVKYILVGGKLTGDGTQWSTEVTTGTANEEKLLLANNLDLKVNVNRISGGVYINTAKDIDVPKDIFNIYFNLDVQFKAVSSATADISWMAQGRNKGETTWINIFSNWITYANIGTSYVAKNIKGYFQPEAGFNQLPAEFQIIFKCDEANEGKGQVKNTSYIEVNCLEPLC